MNSCIGIHLYALAFLMVLALCANTHMETSIMFMLCLNGRIPRRAMKMRMANHNSSFSFYPFNRIPSHQNVCARKIKAKELLVVAFAVAVDTSTYAVILSTSSSSSSSSVAMVVAVAATVVSSSFNSVLADTKCILLLPVCLPIQCAFHIPSRCMAINSFGWFHFFLLPPSLPLLP